MDYNLLANLQSCAEVFQSASSLVYYTHIPPVIIALIFGFYILLNRRDTAGYLLLALSVIFSIYIVSDLILWSQTDKNTLLYFTWSLLGFLSVIMFFLSHWFVHVFVNEKKLQTWMFVLWVILLSPVLALTPTTFNIAEYDLASCSPIEGTLFTIYYYGLGVVAMLLIAISAYHGLRKSSLIENASRSARILVVIGSELFIFAFLFTGLLSSYLVSSGVIPDFGLDQYGMATMSVFIGILAYVTVRYKAFNIKLLAAQALVFALVILIASEFAFVSSTINRTLVGITLLLTVVFGFLLVRSVKQEVRQREFIQKQEEELEVVNKQQENLLHFISHEIKSYLTKSQGAFASIVEGDYGTVAPQLKEMATAALVDVRKGVATVMQILNASNLKKGTMSYDKKPFDFKASVLRVVNDIGPEAEEKNLKLETSIADGDYMMNGDEHRIRSHVIHNIIDNAIKYTPSGVVHIELSDGDKILFSVKDNGVGITNEDKQRLFTEGGHGRDSIKVNVHSTGYGLFIAKSIVEAHGGRIWAESEGSGKGSTFTVELPAIQ